MIHESAPHRVFKISELTRFIASQLVPLDSEAAVNLACVCRCLEEPVLSTLWESQSSLYILVEVLPEEAWKSEYQSGGALRIVGEPSPEALNRVRCYASWMHYVEVDERSDLSEDTFDKIRLISPPNGLFPALRGLCWCITEFNLPYIDLCFSPRLEKVSIYTPSSWCRFEVPHDILTAVASAISALPVSTLQSLSVDIQSCDADLEYFQDPLSSAVLRCGPSLVEVNSTTPLSDAAINHLIHLPHLHTWRIEGPSPSHTVSPLSLTFPPLEKLILGKGAAHGWLSLFRGLEDSVPKMQGATPLSKMKESLKSLEIDDPFRFITDIPSTSPIQIFRNLVSIDLGSWCLFDYEGHCLFKLNNDDVTHFAMALPRLEFLFFGPPCSGNTCATTVACLLSISVHCVRLQRLQIHFNTTNIVDDLKDISKDPRFQGLHALPRCTLSHLVVFEMPLTVDEPGFETVVNGMTDIFPSLKLCEGSEDIWGKISKAIAELQEL